MLEYAFETIPVNWLSGKIPGQRHQEIIRRRAAEGWRYAGWIPSQQMSGGITQLDLVFEREVKA